MLRYIAPKPLRTRFNLPALNKGTCRLLIKIADANPAPLMVTNGVVAVARTRVLPKQLLALKNQKLIEETAPGMYRLTQLGEQVAEAARSYNLEDNEP